MKLFHSPYSPFVRQVRVLAFERGLTLPLEFSGVSPVERNHALAAHNPHAQLPTLLLDDGTALYDSRVILEYLDSLPGGPRLFPTGETRFATLTLLSLADAMLDACVLLRYETFLRPEALRWPAWIEGRRQKIDASLDAFAHRHFAALGGPLDVGVLAVGCALGYLDLRFADYGWRATRPELAAWYEAFRERPSMKATAPPEA